MTETVYVWGRQSFTLRVPEPCSHHVEHDERGEPLGQPCGEPATHVIFWDSEQYSPGCERHVQRDTFDDVGWARITTIVPISHLTPVE